MALRKYTVSVFFLGLRLDIGVCFQKKLGFGLEMDIDRKPRIGLGLKKISIRTTLISRPMSGSVQCRTQGRIQGGLP